MRKVIRFARAHDPITAEWLEVIDAFDQLTSERASVERLARKASEVTARHVGVDDTWNGRRITVPERPITDDMIGQAVLEVVVTRRLRGRRAAVVQADEHEAVAACVEVGAGRIGAVWLTGGAGAWTPLDYLVAERLAAAVAIDAMQLHSAQQAKSRVDPAAIERLLAGPVTEPELAQLARQTQLQPGRKYVALAISENPRAAASTEAIGAIVARALVAHGVTSRSAVLGRTASVVAESDLRVPDALDQLPRITGRLGFRLEIGVGEPGPLADIHRSWQHAREALALRSLVAGGGDVVEFRDLGILHLLVQIPRTELVATEDFRKLTAFDVHRGGPSDLDLLEEYLDSGSLRKAATRLFMHHTTVEYRLKRIERELGFSLSEPANRQRMKLTITLIRIHRVLDT